MVQTADGAAALDLNGNLLWSYVAWAQAATNYLQLDYDTGSSVMIRNLGRSTETASFVNKNSSMYTFNISGLGGPPSSAVLQQQLVFNPNFGYGQYASPTTDGVNVVVQTGAYSNSTPAAARRTARDPSATRLQPDFLTPHGSRRPSKVIAGYHSFLEAFNPSGQSLWSYEMQSIMQGYAAITNGVVVSPGDSAIVALAMNGNGTPLWTYPTAGAIDSSPAVVPSGIYIGDLNGNVYAFAPPYATTTPHRKNGPPHRTMQERATLISLRRHAYLRRCPRPQADQRSSDVVADDLPAVLREVSVLACEQRAMMRGAQDRREVLTKGRSSEPRSLCRSLGPIAAHASRFAGRYAFSTVLVQAPSTGSTSATSGSATIDERNVG